MRTFYEEYKELELLEKNKDYITTSEALSLVKDCGINVARSTLLGWVRKFNLGFQPGGDDSVWFIHKESLINLIVNMGGRLNTPIVKKGTKKGRRKNIERNKK